MSKHKRNTVDLFSIEKLLGHQFMDLCLQGGGRSWSWSCLLPSCCFQNEKHKHHMLPEQTGLCWFCGWVRWLPVFVGISAADSHLRTIISGQGIIPKHTVRVGRTVSGPEYFLPSSSQISERCFQDSWLISFWSRQPVCSVRSKHPANVWRTPEC